VRNLAGVQHKSGPQDGSKIFTAPGEKDERPRLLAEAGPGWGRERAEPGRAGITGSRNQEA